jgi:hypothetical protein
MLLTALSSAASRRIALSFPTAPSG